MDYTHKPVSGALEVEEPAAQYYFGGGGSAVAEPNENSGAPERMIIRSDDIDPDDYDNDTDYLYAIPGFVDRILKARNAPLSQSKPVPEAWFNV